MGHEGLVIGVWRRLVFENHHVEPGLVDHRAYAFCVLKQLHRGRRRRDVSVVRSEQWRPFRCAICLMMGQGS